MYLFPLLLYPNPRLPPTIYKFFTLTFSSSLLATALLQKQYVCKTYTTIRVAVFADLLVERGAILFDFNGSVARVEDQRSNPPWYFAVRLSGLSQDQHIVTCIGSFFLICFFMCMFSIGLTEHYLNQLNNALP